MNNYISRRHFADKLLEEMRKDERIWVLTADLGYKMWDEIQSEFPDRFVNVGAAEQLLLGVGVGLALEGKIPICYSITPFLLFRPAEWIRNYLDKENIPVKLVGAGLNEDYHHDGFSHHIFDIEKYMSYFPNISLHLPEKTPESLEKHFHEFVYSQKPSLLVLRK